MWAETFAAGIIAPGNSIVTGFVVPMDQLANKYNFDNIDISLFRTSSARNSRFQ